MGPLSGKQQREYAKFAAKEQRESAKAESEESRKQELHEIKLQEAAAKANQQLGHKEDAHSAKMSESGGPLSRKYSVGAIEVIPVNYMKQGGGDRQITGHATGGNSEESHPVMPSDTVPAMLTPGEAVIPKEAAQIPANKEIIQRMVNQGREIQGHATGTINVRDNMPSLPIIGVKRRGVKGYAGGGEVKASPSIAGRMWDTFINHGFKAATPSAPVVPEVVAKPVPRVITINGQDVVVGGPQPVVPQVVQTNDQAQILRGLDVLMPGMQAASKGVRPDTRGYAGGAVEVDGSDNRFSRQGTPEQAPIIVPQVVSQQEDVPVVSVLPKPPLSDRNNNPGNLRFVGQAGGEKGEGGFARFTSYDVGMDALHNQLNLDTQKRGLTLNQTMNKYAPTVENNTSAYTKHIADTLGIKPGDKVPPELVPKMAEAIAKYEGGKNSIANKSKPVPVVVPPTDTTRVAGDGTMSYGEQMSNVGKFILGGGKHAFMSLVSAPGYGLSKDNPLAYPGSPGYKAAPVAPTVPPVPAGGGRGSVNPPVVVPQPGEPIVEPLPDTGAGAGRGSQGIVSPTNPDSEQMIADMGRSNQDVLSSPPPEATTPEEKKAWYEDVLHSIYGGPDSMFNQKDLIRFVGGAAFRMATGDTVNNALRAASGDVLNQSDKRHAVEQTEKMAQNRLDSAEEKALRNSLLSQQYSPERVEAYLKAKKASEQKGGKEIDPNILGDAKTTTRKVGKPEQYTFSSGPLMGQQFPAQKHEIMTGKRKGDEVWTVNGIPVEDFAGVMAASNPANKHAIGSAQFVPYSDGEHGIRARTARYDAFESKINDSATDIYKTSLGTQDVKGKPGNWENLPSPTKVANQTRMFFESRGDYNPDDPQQRTQLNAVTQNAISKMIDMNRDSKTKVPDITPYLAQEIILGTSGVNKGAFMVGNTPMAAGKIADMDDNLKYSIRKSNPKANPSEVEQLKAKRLRDLYLQYNKEKPVMGSDKESGFYQYVTSKLK